MILKELQAATKTAQASGKNLIHLKIIDFPLPNLSIQLQKFADELENGSGVIKLTGFSVENFTFFRNTNYFLGHWYSSWHTGFTK